MPLCDKFIYQRHNANEKRNQNQINMNTVTIHPAKSKMSFDRAAKSAVKISREQKVIVRFVSGGQKFQVSPKTALQTVLWTRAIKQPARRPAKVKPVLAD